MGAISPQNTVPAGALTISHEAVVAAYQDRLAAVTHENVQLGIIVQQQAQQLAALREPGPPPMPPPIQRPVRVPSEPVDCATEGTKE